MRLSGGFLFLAFSVRRGYKPRCVENIGFVQFSKRKFMALGKVQIINSALSCIGERPISSDVTDTSERAKVSNRRYDEVRNSLLRCHPWNFAIKRFKTNAKKLTPVFGFDYAYDLPEDCLRVLGTDNESYVWQIEADSDQDAKGGLVILTDRSDFPSIQYVYEVTDPTKFDSIFVQAFIYRLAAEFAQDLTGRAELSAKMLQQYLGVLAEARSINASEGTPQKIEADLWLAARRSGVSLPPFSTDSLRWMVDPR